ncbi:MAG TPA: inositol monophosphatase family protein [Thermoanaerobaculia bacterium]|nr:inositol monophosphatase family protein [Thermoanaerobaculia bacterium]
MNPIELAQEAARIGADVLLRHWEVLNKDDADLKARNDWVSRADRESEEAIVTFLRAHRPEDDFLGEEGGRMIASAPDGTKGGTWVIDPLDGTSNYLQHFPFWSVSIAYREGNEVTVGVVYEPIRQMMFAAEKGAGAFRNGNRMQVSTHEKIEGSFLATGFPFRAQKFVSVYCAIFQEVISVSKGVRRAGSAALDLAYTAAGVFDGFFELHLAPWDIAAGALLVQEAGGRVSDFSGGSSFWTRGNIIGASPGVHEDLIAMVSRHVREDQLDR